MSVVQIVPDTKDWTWVLDRVCDECGYDAKAVRRHGVPSTIRRNAAEWLQVLATPEVRRRPSARTWSPLEYGCHVRDVFRLYDQRLGWMLERDDPTFDNWDQDDAARSGGYHRQDPALVGPELTAAGAAVATTYDGVRDLAWDRTGRRSNGSEFTVLSLGRYLLHDLYHHLYDVGA